MSESVKTLLTILRHRELVSENLGKIGEELQSRAARHDRSKLQADEFDGFVRINKVARDHEYGSEAYIEGLASEGGESGCINLHYARNSHHPEHHKNDRDMGWVDIVEMVCDWSAASITYGNQSLRESVQIQHERFDFSEGQWWLIYSVIDWLNPKEEK